MGGNATKTHVPIKNKCMFIAEKQTYIHIFANK